MTSSREGNRLHTTITVALAIAAACATALATDNLLGFAGYHILAVGSVPLIAASAVTAGVVVAVCAAPARDAARLIAAVAVCGFMTTSSPATSSDVWLPASIALQALVPLSFAGAAVLFLRCPRYCAVSRVLATLLLGFAIAWTASAFIPVPLEVFLVAQAATLLSTLTLDVQPVFHRGRAIVRELWSTARVR